MSDSLASALHLVFSTLALVAAPDPSTIGALGLALAVVSAALAVAALLAMALPTLLRSSFAHPTRAIDISSPLAQSDPDAAGHARPRAPGGAASAA